MTDIQTLRALLTEARNELGTLDALTLHPNVDSEKDGLIQLLRRIDAALAESEVRWGTNHLTSVLVAQVNGYSVRITPGANDVVWSATPHRHWPDKGISKTIEGAKEAALTAVGWRNP